MSFETCNNRDVDLCQGDEMLCQDCNEKQPQKLYSCDARKKTFKTLKGRNLHVAKSRNCDRQSNLNSVNSNEHWTINSLPRANSVSTHTLQRNVSIQQQSVKLKLDTSNVTESGTERYVKKPSHIPLYEELNTPKLIKWGNTNGVDILIPTSLFDNAYDEIVLWRKNTFLVPYGKVGREFIDTNLIKQWNDRTQLQCITLKAFFVLLAVGLQKPSTA